MIILPNEMPLTLEVLEHNDMYDATRLIKVPLLGGMIDMSLCEPPEIDETSAASPSGLRYGLMRVVREPSGTTRANVGVFGGIMGIHLNGNEFPMARIAGGFSIVHTPEIREFSGETILNLTAAGKPQSTVRFQYRKNVSKEERAKMLEFTDTLIARNLR